MRRFNVLLRPTKQHAFSSVLTLACFGGHASGSNWRGVWARSSLPRDIPQAQGAAGAGDSACMRSRAAGLLRAEVFGGGRAARAGGRRALGRRLRLGAYHGSAALRCTQPVWHWLHLRPSCSHTLIPFLFPFLNPEGLRSLVQSRAGKHCLWCQKLDAAAGSDGFWRWYACPVGCNVRFIGCCSVWL